MLLSLFLMVPVTAQEYGCDKGAHLISGTGSFSFNSGGPARGDEGAYFLFSAVFNHFVAPSFFLGLGADVNVMNTESQNANAYAFGPQLGLMHANDDKDFFTFLSIGGRFRKENATFRGTYYSPIPDYAINGFDAFLSTGVVLELKDHIGLVFEPTIRLTNLYPRKGKAPDSYLFIGMGIGLAGLLY